MPDPDIPPATSDDHGNEPPAVIQPVTCVACGCLCDDLVVSRKGETLVEVGNGCEIAQGWFLTDQPDHAGFPVAEIDGQPATMAEAANRTAALLAGARAPVILGLSGSTNETVAAALQLADAIGALVDPTGSSQALARSLALARVGRVSATLGEVKNRADVVVFWGADPVRMHPRHWERYSVMPSGRFVPSGRAGRTVVVVDDHRSATAEQADHFLEIDRKHEFEILWTLRALVKGVEIDGDRVRTTAGVDIERLRRLAGVFKAARYGAMFHVPPQKSQALTESSAIVEAVHGLVRELNRHSRFVILGMGETGNPTGAEAVMTWQTGFPTGVDLSAGFPASLPGVSSASERLRRAEIDVLLVVGSSGLTPADHAPGRQQRIMIAPPEAPGARVNATAVRCHAATPGLDESGTVMRSDGVALPLRAVRRASFPTAREWLESINREFHALVKR
jgi:formylmethanofuran dehydrogenase subunit B